MISGSNKKNGGRRRRYGFGLMILALAGVFFGYACAVDRPDPIIDAPADLPDLVIGEPVDLLDVELQGTDYSRFRHNNPSHAQVSCLLCHRRDNNSARIGFPGKSGHIPCAGCHTQQFADNSSPMCTICHTDPGSGAMKRFPGLRSFGSKFDHARHTRVNCSVCHKPSQRGVAFSIPDRVAAHTTCFQCHTSSSGQRMSSCSTCHQPGRLVRTPETAKSFEVNFSHARHSRAGLNCSSCHTIRRGSPRGRQVSAPVASMHFASGRVASCASCHNGTRSFGASDFDDCKRCHTGSTFRF